MPRTEYEFRYTIEGWYTEAALAEGFTEEASSGNKKLTMRASMAGPGRVNMYLLRVTKDEKEIYFKLYRNLRKSRETFAKVCAKHRLQHKRFNPQ